MNRLHIIFSGYYQLRVFQGENTVPHYQSEWFPNIITDNGLDLLGEGFSPRAFVGTSAAPETAADTQITDAVGSVEGDHDAEGTQILTAPFYGWSRTLFSWEPGAIQTTIAEVGIGGGAANLFSRSLIKTSGGVPMTLTLGGVDRLELVYELRQCIDTTDLPFSILVNSTATSGVVRPAQIDDFHGWAPALGAEIGRGWVTLYCDGNSPFIGSVTEEPDGITLSQPDIYITSHPTSSLPENAYEPGSYIRTYTVTCSWKLGAINITAMRIGGKWVGEYAGTIGGAWQFSLIPAVAKGEFEDFHLDYEFSWGRCT